MAGFGARELAEPAPGYTATFRRADAPPAAAREFLGATGNSRHEHDSGQPPGLRTRRSPAAGHAWPLGGRRRPADDPDPGAHRRGRRAGPAAPPPGATAVAVASTAGLVLTIGATVVFAKGPSSPPSVATVQERDHRCLPESGRRFRAGPGQFRCGKGVRPVAVGFALLTAIGNPGYADAGTSRKGLSPVTPAQGGQIAWSLNLHHPYDPFHPIDSLEVAARAINNIIGGATVTGANGNPTVQPGLESKPGNCARYTGSPAIISHAGFPSLCASPVTSGEGQAALVADVYQQWMVGATAVAAQDVSVLFENAAQPRRPAGAGHPQDPADPGGNDDSASAAHSRDRGRR